MAQNDAPNPAEPTQIRTQAFQDAKTVEKPGSFLEQAENYHNAYTGFSKQLQSISPDDQTKALGQYRTEMGKAIGPDHLHQLELLYGAEKMENFSAADQMKTTRTRGSFSSKDSGNLDVEKLKDFHSKAADPGERNFQNDVAKSINEAKGQGEFSHGWFFPDNSYVSRADLEKSGTDPKYQNEANARGEALNLMTPIKPELAKEFGVERADGKPATVYDLLKEPDGSIKKYGYNTKFADMHAKLREGDMSPEQMQAVKNLWDGWSDAKQNPLKDSRTGSITPDSIKKTTGEDVDSLRDTALELRKGQDAPEAKIDAPAKPEGTLEQPNPGKPEVSPEQTGKPAGTPDETRPPKPEQPDNRIPPGSPEQTGGPAKPAGAPEPGGEAKPAGTPEASDPPKPAGKPEASDPGKPTGKPEATDPPKPAGKPEATDPSKPAGESPVGKNEGTPGRTDEPKPPASAEQPNALQKLKIDSTPLIEQARHALQEKEGDKHKVSDSEARQFLADLAKENHLPGSDKQWAAYVRDGKTAHLPKSLNKAIINGKEMILPEIHIQQ